jgi:hypothetical protein
MTPQHSKNWDKLTAPARPSPSVVNQYKELIPDGNVLLLGVTPEIANSYQVVTAIDSDEKMIKNVWPGDSLTKRVFHANWETFVTHERFNGIIGDVALTLLADKKKITSFNQKCFDMLLPNGVVAQRIFHKPNDVLDRNQLIDMLSKPATINFNAFKWLMFMTYSNETHQKISFSKVRKFFNEIAPDRQQVSENTGWTIEQINTIDFYENTTAEVIVLSKKEWLETVPKGAKNVHFYYQEDYDLAELCPILSYVKPV